VTFSVVALGWFGTTVVLATEGEPHTISGVDPVTMGGGAQGLKVSWPCLSKKGLVSTEMGVFYPTTAGLALIGDGGGVMTREFYTEEEWRDINPETFIGSYRDNKYYAGYSNDDGEGRIIIIDKTEYASVTLAIADVSRLWTDPLSGTLYAVIGSDIYQWDAPDAERALFDWMSKEFVFAPPINMAVGKVDADFTASAAEIAAAQAAYDAAVAANAALLAAGNLRGATNATYANRYSMNGDALSPAPSIEYDALTFELWADEGDGLGMALKHSEQVTSSRAFRLPDGFTADALHVRLSGNIKVSRVILAPTMQALRQV
jgi:hypothetical protein